MMIENSLIIALMVLFWCSLFWEGMIFEWFKKIVSPEKSISKPLYGCPICATPWWGTGFYWIFFHKGIADWLLTIGAAAGISVIFVVLLSIRDACLVYIEKNEK